MMEQDSAEADANTPAAKPQHAFIPCHIKIRYSSNAMQHGIRNDICKCQINHRLAQFHTYLPSATPHIYFYSIHSTNTSESVQNATKFRHSHTRLPVYTTQCTYPSIPSIRPIYTWQIPLHRGAISEPARIAISPPN